MSTRVINLTDALGRQLFEAAVRGQEEGKGGGAPARLSREEKRLLDQSVREQKRRRRLEGRAHL